MRTRLLLRARHRVIALGACWLASGVVTGCSKPGVMAVPALPIPELPIVLPLLNPPPPLTLFHEPFETLDPKRWREIEIKGATTFSIEDVDGVRVLKAHSNNAASILLAPFRFKPDRYPWLSWRWRVDALLEHEDLRTKAGSDAVARVYVYFDTPGLPWQKRNLDYLWSSSLPAGTILPSAFADSSMVVVVEGGPEHLGTWRAVTRNIPDDYRRCFGADPPDVLAIGLVTDSDSTHTEATAYYDEILLTTHPPESFPEAQPQPPAPPEPDPPQP